MTDDESESDTSPSAEHDTIPELPASKRWYVLSVLREHGSLPDLAERTPSRRTAPLAGNDHGAVT